MSDSSLPWENPKIPAIRPRHVPEKVARWIVEHNKVDRVSGGWVCDCGEEARFHPEVIATFVLLCDGRVGKT